MVRPDSQSTTETEARRLFLLLGPHFSQGTFAGDGFRRRHAVFIIQQRLNEVRGIVCRRRLIRV
jgi:hypothetical protein